MSKHDDPRDEHLRAALRHAPDADVQAPAALRERILREARATAGDPQSTALAAPGWALRLWDWLARPAVATGFAGVMAATLVGLMWWDEPMDAALPRSPVPPVTPAPAPAAPSPAAPERAAAEPSAAPPAVATPPATAATPSPRDTRERKARPQPPAAAERPRIGEVAPPPARPAQPVAAAAPPPAAPAPAPAADQVADEAQAHAAQQRLRSEAASRARATDAASELAAGEAPRSALARAQLNEARAQRESEASRSLTSLRAALAREPARWSFQRGEAPAQPLNDALANWLAALDGATGTRWQALAESEPAGTPLGRPILLRREGQVQHTLQFTEHGLRWTRGHSTWQVPLSAEQRSALQAALDQAAP